MQSALQVMFRDMERSEELETRIRARADKLEQFHQRITGCRVTVEESHRHQNQGRHFGVRVDLQVPGRGPIVSSMHHHEDVYVAVRDAFDAVERRLEEDTREVRGHVKAHDELQHGKVARMSLEEGFGFIEAADGAEYYFSRANVVHPAFDRLAPGTEVQFLVELAAEGAQAKRVSAGKHRF